MYAQLPLYDFNNDSQASARIILGGRNIFIGIRQMLGDFLAVLTASLFALPFILIIKYLRFRLKKRFPVHLQIDSSNYVYIRETFDDITSVMNQFKLVQNISTTQLPLIMKIIVNQVNQLVATVETCQKHMEQALSQLDDIPTKSKPKVFELVKESELWANRPHVYQYRV